MSPSQLKFGDGAVKTQACGELRVIHWSEDLIIHQTAGLKVLLSCPADEREAVQKKTFTKWVNSHLARVSCRITDLYMDLRDGRMLIKLLEVLSGERLVSPISLLLLRQAL